MTPYTTMPVRVAIPHTICRADVEGLPGRVADVLSNGRCRVSLEATDMTPAMTLELPEKAQGNRDTGWYEPDVEALQGLANALASLPKARKAA